ncbi:MAG: hypothetical protein IJH14_10215 [Solobacterium sp.]|nr:hypothetical protein [Solobacterium sp.]
MNIGLFNIILYILMFYSIYRLFTASRRNSKGKELISIVSNVNHKEEFMEQIDELISTCGDPVYENKARVIKLWGQAYHKDYADFASTAESLNVNELIQVNKKGEKTITENEDSFFYLCLGIPNLLYANDAMDCVKILQDKIKPFEEELSDQLVAALGEANRDFCEKRNDQGVSFFQKLLEGDYAGYKYSKGLIGLYKMIANAMLAKYYENEGTLAEHPETKDLLDQFAKTGLGERWMKAIDLKVAAETEEGESGDANEPEEPAEETAPTEEAEGNAVEETAEEEKSE